MYASEAGQARGQPFVGQRAGAGKERRSSLPDSREGMRLIEDFCSIRDSSVRAEIAQMVSKLAKAQFAESR